MARAFSSFSTPAFGTVLACTLTCALLAAPRPASAQQIPPPVQELGDRITREQMQKERRDIVEQETAPIVAEEAAAAAARLRDIDPDSVLDPEPTFFIERIEPQGELPLSESEFRRIVAPFLGKRLGVNRINLLLSRLNQAFVDAGYITTRAMIGDQNLASGTLIVAIVAGRIEKLRYNGRELDDSWPDSWNSWSLSGVRMALPMKKGDLLKLQDIEQGIDQINRLRRNRAEVKILPGETPGGSIVDIVNVAADPFRYQIGGDNQGQQSTGATRSRASVEAGNLLGLMENISLSWNGSLDTNALSASLSLPWGYNTFTALTTWSEYQNLIGEVALVYGTTNNAAFSWNRLIHRDQNSKTTLDLALAHRSAKREINNAIMLPQRLTTLRLGGNHLSRFGGEGRAMDRRRRSHPRPQSIRRRPRPRRPPGRRRARPVHQDRRLRLAHPAAFLRVRLAGVGERPMVERAALFLRTDFCRRHLLHARPARVGARR